LEHSIYIHKKMIQNNPFDEFELCFHPAKVNGDIDDSKIIKSGSDLAKILLNLKPDVEKLTLYMIQINFETP
jgi:hypothetical protein